MRHNKKINHLGRQAGHRKAMMSNMASSLILHKRIETTDDDIDWLLAEEFDADKSSSEEHCENKEVIPSKVFEEDSPSHEKEEIPSHDLWKDSKQFEEIVMVVIEDIIVADLTMTREEAVERATHYNDYVRDALGERMAQVYDRARYEFLTASDAEFDILRESLRRK